MKTLSLTLSILCSVGCFIGACPSDSLGQGNKLAAHKKRNVHRRAARTISALVANGGGSLLRKDYASAEISEKVSDWMKSNESALIGAQPSPFSEPTKWGVATANGNKLYLHVATWPKEGKLLIPRLHNSVVSAKLSHGGEELKLKPNVSDWEITLPEKPKLRDALLPVIEIELDRPVLVGQSVAPTVKAGDDKSIALHSRYAVVHGEMLRFEPQSHKNTVGYWVKEKDWAEWNFVAAKDQTYEVVLRYGCGGGQGGSEIEIKIGEQSLAFTVEATGGFQAWKEVSVGKVSGLDGKTNLSVRPKRKAKNAIMDIQQITLTPVR